MARKRTAVWLSPTAKNSRTVRCSTVDYSSVAVLFRTIKGKTECLVRTQGSDGYELPLAWNLRTVSGFAVLNV
ncbi:MAG: hypothetical protein ACI4WG_07525 [Erysipelotrichaceae bacterium]